MGRGEGCRGEGRESRRQLQKLPLRKNLRKKRLLRLHSSKLKSRQPALPQKQRRRQLPLLSSKKIKMHGSLTLFTESLRNTGTYVKAIQTIANLKSESYTSTHT